MTENETPQDVLSLEGRRAVVTGSSSGIGRAIALELSAAGAEVLIHANRSIAGAEKLRQEITARGARCEFIQADLRTGKAATAFFDVTTDLSSFTSVRACFADISFGGGCPLPRPPGPAPAPGAHEHLLRGRGIWNQVVISASPFAQTTSPLLR